MGFSISKLLGIDDANKQAERANDLNQQQVDLARKEYETQVAAKNKISNQIDSLMNPYLNQIFGTGTNRQNVDGITTYQPPATAGSSGWNQTAEDTMSNLIDILSGKQITSEQQAHEALTGNLIKNLTGENKTAEQKQADNWNQQYLNLLQNSPDTAFNQGLSTVNRSTQDQKNAVSKQMANRGISGSGIALNQIAGTEANRARQISALQGEKVDRQLNNTATGANYANALSQQQLQNTSAAQQLQQNLASQKQSNLENAGVYANNYNQQLLTNIMNMLGNKTNLVNNTGAASLATNALSGAANSAAQNAANSAAGANALISAGTTALTDRLFNNNGSAGTKAVNAAINGLENIGKQIIGLFI